jgi:hypothetical protein
VIEKQGDRINPNLERKQKQMVEINRHEELAQFCRAHIRVARFFLVQHTKNTPNFHKLDLPNDHKIYPMSTK